jgi:hypothetical protein
MSEVGIKSGNPPGKSDAGVKTNVLRDVGPGTRNDSVKKLVPGVLYPW